MIELLSIGSISIDLYFLGKTLTYNNNRFQLAVGGKYLADNFHISIGGGGANVAFGATYFNIRTGVMGVIGNNPFKSIILEEFKKRGISCRYCWFKDNYYNISAILLNNVGERSIIHYVTPHSHLFNDSHNLLGITKIKAVYLGNLPDVPFYQRLIFLRFLKKHRIKTFVNLGVKDCRRPTSTLLPFLNAVDVLIINGHEFAELVKASYSDIHFKEDVVRWYLPIMTDQIVVITEGAKGSYAYYQNRVYHQNAINVEKVIDTTGAGDAYSASFIATFLKTKSIEKSMLKGSHYAAKILQKIGAN